MTVRHRSRGDFDIIPHQSSLVNTFFKSFFTFFDIFLRLLDVMPPFWATFDIIAPTLGFVNSFFEKNRHFYKKFKSAKSLVSLSLL